jgi:hypothetical protein
VKLIVKHIVKLDINIHPTKVSTSQTYRALNCASCLALAGVDAKFAKACTGAVMGKGLPALLSTVFCQQFLVKGLGGNSLKLDFCRYECRLMTVNVLSRLVGGAYQVLRL